jgi:hypothetical protein
MWSEHVIPFRLRSEGDRGADLSLVARRPRSHRYHRVRCVRPSSSAGCLQDSARRPTWHLAPDCGGQSVRSLMMRSNQPPHSVLVRPVGNLDGHQRSNQPSAIKAATPRTLHSTTRLLLGLLMRANSETASIHFLRLSDTNITKWHPARGKQGANLWKAWRSEGAGAQGLVQERPQLRAVPLGLAAPVDLPASG